jgi:release factor glutamine methyltransferase
MTVGDAVRAARARLVAAGIAEEEASLDAALLAMQLLHCDRATLITRGRERASAQFLFELDMLVRRRESREPMAYIRGVQEFWGRDFIVSPAVLIPRPETELIVEEALRLRSLERHVAQPLGPVPLIVDVGTGSGCLAVTLACEWPDARVVATDISDAALGIARENARRHDVESRIRFVAQPYLADVDEPIDLVVANPPYVAGADLSALQPEVRDHEPRAALFGGADGLREVRAILHDASTRLARNGRLLMEIGAGQADAVGVAVHGTPGLSLLDIRADLQGIPRVAIIAWE